MMKGLHEGTLHHSLESRSFLVVEKKMNDKHIMDKHVIHWQEAAQRLSPRADKVLLHFPLEDVNLLC
jgi:hypothetical protein